MQKQLSGLMAGELFFAGENFEKNSKKVLTFPEKDV